MQDRDAAIHEVITAIENGEGTRDEYDIDAIVDDTYHFDPIAGYVPNSSGEPTLDVKAFWESVQRHTL